jgi:hypothetical protein
MKTRFDMEQEIMQCWNVIDDLKVLQETNNLNEESVKALCTLYSIKFNMLFETFEQLIAERKIL